MDLNTIVELILSDIITAQVSWLDRPFENLTKKVRYSDKSRIWVLSIQMFTVIKSLLLYVLFTGIVGIL